VYRRYSIAISTAMAVLCMPSPKRRMVDNNRLRLPRVPVNLSALANDGARASIGFTKAMQEVERALVRGSGRVQKLLQEGDIDAKTGSSLVD
jgi:hypothetical protein